MKTTNLINENVVIICRKQIPPVLNKKDDEKFHNFPLPQSKTIKYN